MKKIPTAALEFILYGENSEESVQLKPVYSDNGKWYGLHYGGLQEMLKRCFTFSSSDSLRRWAEEFMTKKTCSECNGYRLKKESYWFKIAEKHIGELATMDVQQLSDWFVDVEERLTDKQNLIARDVLKEIRERLSFLMDVGLEYLSLDRPARSLSGGEAQRIRLATQNWFTAFRSNLYFR